MGLTEKAFGEPHRVSWRNFWVCLLVSSGQLAFGYYASVIGTTLGQPTFLLYMKLIDAKGELVPGAEGIIGAMNGVFQVSLRYTPESRRTFSDFKLAGAFFSVLLVSWISDKYGRKAAFVYSGLVSIFGGALLAASQNQAMFIVFRFFAGAGSWAFLSITPTYTAELSPPEKRGFFVGLNGVFITGGYSLATYMGLAFYFVNSSSTWRGPLGIALIWPVLILCFLPVIPESPRWLLMHDRSQEAEKVLRDLHQDSTESGDTYVRAEFFQIKEQVRLDLNMSSSWREIFTRPSYRRRAILTIGFAFLSQSCGPLVINNYGPSIYKSLGFGTVDQLGLACGWITLGAVSNLIGAWVVDSWGRRPLMYLGAAGCCFCLALEAGLTAAYAPTGSNKGGLGAAVFALYFFMIFYSIGMDVGGYVYYSEIWPNHLRSRGLALAVATNALTDLVYLQVTPTAFATIGWKYFLVFIVISGLGSIWVYFAFPETRGIPLEEVAKLFGDTNEVAVFSRDIRVSHRTVEIRADRNLDDESTAATAEKQEEKEGNSNEAGKEIPHWAVEVEHV